MRGPVPSSAAGEPCAQRCCGPALCPQPPPGSDPRGIRSPPPGNPLNRAAQAGPAAPHCCREGTPGDTFPVTRLERVSDPRPPCPGAAYGARSG